MTSIPAKPQLVILGKPNCCLCDEAKDIARAVRRRLEFDLQILDVTRDPELAARHQYEVPVVFLNGVKIFKYKVDENELVRKLQRVLKRETTSGTEKAG